MSFEARIERAITFFKTLSHPRIIAHLDADGLCAAAIISKAFNIDKVSVVPHLSERTMKFEEDLIIVDAGSSHLDLLNDLLPNQKVLIIDHHKMSGEVPDNFFLLNPLFDELDGSRDACSSTIAYEFAKSFDNKNVNLAHLGVIGFIADAQDKLGIHCLNKKALETAIQEKLISVSQDLKFMGIHSKPLAKLLSTSYDLKIPGVTNDYKGSQKLLRELNISEFNADHKKTYIDLSDEEKTTLRDSLVNLKGTTEGLFTNHYTLLEEPPGPTRDVREYATLLNACGRLEKPNIALKLLKGDSSARSEIQEVSKEYKISLGKAMKLYKDMTVAKENNFLIINAKNKILPSIAGTLCSILTRGGNVSKGTLVMALARYKTNETKVSLRVAGYDSDVDLLDVLQQIVLKVDGDCGGHKSAAGAIISTDKEEEFIEEAKKVFTGL